MGVNLSFDSTATEAELKAIRAYINARLGEEPTVLTVKGGVETRVPASEFQAKPEPEPGVTTEAVNDAPPAPARRKPGPKPKPKPEPEPVEDEDEDEDVMGDSGVTIDDAKSKAKELVGEGRTADVRKALQAVGKNRVSEIATNAEAAAFVKALG